MHQTPAQDPRQREAADPVRAEDPGIATLAGEEGHHAGREQQPDQQRQAPVGCSRRHDNQSVRPQKARAAGEAGPG